MGYASFKAGKCKISDFCIKKTSRSPSDGNYPEIPDGCSILSAIYILRGMYMKCHFYVHRHLNLLGIFCHLMQLLQTLQQLLRFVFEPVGMSDKLNSPKTPPIDMPYHIFQAQVQKLQLYFHTAICYYLFSHSLITSRL